MKTTIKTKLQRIPLLLVLLFNCALLSAADGADQGLNANLANLYQVSKAESRSISPENFSGEKGKGGMATNGTGKYAAGKLGQGWKVSPPLRSRREPP